MRLKDIITADKEITDPGKWISGTLMPRAIFPIHGTTKIVRKVFTWKIIKFKIGVDEYRLLIFYRLDKQDYYAWLALDTDPVTVIAKYEYHATHPGWHLHACCETDRAPAGRTKGHFDRLPGGAATHRDKEFGISIEQDAEIKASDMFGLWRKVRTGNPETRDMFRP